jgi:hypothetical protein
MARGLISVPVREAASGPPGEHLIDAGSAAVPRPLPRALRRAPLVSAASLPALAASETVKKLVDRNPPRFLIVLTRFRAACRGRLRIRQLGRRTIRSSEVCLVLRAS